MLQTLPQHPNHIHYVWKASRANIIKNVLMSFAMCCQAHDFRRVFWRENNTFRGKFKTWIWDMENEFHVPIYHDYNITKCSNLREQAMDIHRRYFFTITSMWPFYNKLRWTLSAPHNEHYVTRIDNLIKISYVLFLLEKSCCEE